MSVLNVPYDHPHTCHLSAALPVEFLNHLLECQAYWDSHGWRCRGPWCLGVTDPTAGQSLGWQPLSDAANREYHPQQNAHRTRARLRLQGLCEYPSWSSYVPGNHSCVTKNHLFVAWGLCPLSAYQTALELIGVCVPNKALLADYLWCKSGLCSAPWSTLRTSLFLYTENWKWKC